MRLADERGFSLIELLLVMGISLLLLGATLTTFNAMEKGASDNNKRNDTAELARNALESQARQLRNLAKRVSSPVIDTVGPYDLIFQTAEPSRTWVRYCLDTAAPASVDRARLWMAELSVPLAAAATPITAGQRGACPGTGWSKTSVVTDFVTNRRSGLNRPLFTYGCTTGTTCTSSPATYDQVITITAQTYVDSTPGTSVPELRVTSGVHMRNQNQPPVARFESSPGSASRTVVLNAAGSSDYEGRTLSYYWFEETMPAAASIDCARPTVTGTGSPRTLWGANGYIGEGITLTYTFPASSGAAGSLRHIGLVACDPGDRQDTEGIAPEASISVQIPA